MELEVGGVITLTEQQCGAVLSSAYNARPLVPEVLVDGYRYEIVRRRPSFEESIGLEKVPDWLTTVA